MADQDFRKAGMLGDGDVSHLVHIFDDDLVGTLRALTDVAKVLLFAHRGLSVTDMVFAVDGITGFGKMLCKAVETVDMFTDTVGDEGDRFGLDSVIDPGQIADTIFTVGRFEESFFTFDGHVSSSCFYSPISARVSFKNQLKF